MNDPSQLSNNQARSLVGFSIRDLLLMLTLVALCFAWWVDRNRRQNDPYDVTGPIMIGYTIRTSDSNTSSRHVPAARGIDFRENNIVVHSSNGGAIVPTGNLVEFNGTNDLQITKG